MARMTLDEINAARPTVDRAKVAATTEEDIRGYQVEEGHDPDAESVDVEVVVPAQVVRKSLGMSQDAFASALRIPIGTLRNWEQGRVKPDPAARSLLVAVHRNPTIVLDSLGPRKAG